MTDVYDTIENMVSAKGSSKKGKRMYLSELFLDVLGEDYSKEAVKEALARCSQEMFRRMGSFEDEKRLETVFFQSEEGRNPTEAFEEIMAFWDVYGEFDGCLLPEEKKEFPILQTVYEVGGMYHSIRNQMLLETMEGTARMRLQQLCKAIEELYNTKLIKFFVKEKSGMKLCSEMSLEGFEKALFNYDYAAVQNHLIDTMKTGGIAVVVAGTKGLTPQRLYGFVLTGKDWHECPSALLEMFREEILAEHPGVRRRV